MSDDDSPHVLVIDDEQSLLETLEVLLEDEGYEVSTALTGQEGLEIFDEVGPDLVLLDIRMPKMGGVEVLEEIRDRSESVPVVLITAQASLNSAIEAVNLGANHYVRKPFSNDELLAIIRRSLEWGETARENVDLKQQLKQKEEIEAERPVGQAAPFEEALHMAESVASSDSTVLLEGESGAGKEVFARHIHRLSSRADLPFHSLNCGAVPESLLESELFGHKEGSFTGATGDKEGIFTAAHGGTLLLDEVAEMSPSVQVKLLRVLQNGEVTPVGSTESVNVDVRLIAATNRDLEQEMESGGFREDLFYRLNVINIEVPPLRDRLEDIPLLAEHFLETKADAVGDDESAPTRISPGAMEVLEDYHWPGNVRELENVMERAIVLADGEEIDGDVLPDRLSEPEPEPLVSGERPENPSLEVIERAYIEHVLSAEDGNKTRAAEVLGIDPSTLYRKIKRYEIEA